MRATLIEVEGEEVGTALHSIEWLRDRVRWHLDPALSTGAVFLAQNESGAIVGHTLVRRELNENGIEHGLVATTYVDPPARRGGVATALLRAGEAWFTGLALTRFATWTSSTNVKLIQLYEKHGYRQAATHRHEVGTLMVKLERCIDATSEKL